MFKMTIEYLSDKDIIKITTLGVLDIAADKELVAAGISASRQYGSTKFLVDHRMVELNLRMMDVDDVPLIAERAGLSPNAYIALLRNESQRAKEIFSYIDDKSYLKHGPRRVFTDEGEAISWLASRS